MADENIEKKVREEVTDILAEELKVKREEIRDNSNLQQDLGADSLDAVEVIMKLEEKYSIEIPDDDAQKLTTAGQIMEYISGKVKGKGQY